MARRRKGRPVNGVLLVDKPKGFSSNGVLQKVRWLYQAQKAGHTGALDPAATGLLPICFGEATKFTRFLLDSDKRYVTTGTLGVSTDTLDAEGHVLDVKPVPEIDIETLSVLIETKFTGHVEQVPPMYSALKRDGKKLYELAREGKSIDLDPRPVTIYENRVLIWNSPELTLDVHCSKGTYIRTLMSDIGDLIGCGAHVNQLRRTMHGQFYIDQAISLDRLEELRSIDDYSGLDALLLTIDDLLADFTKITLSENRSKFFSNGNDVQIDHPPCLARVYNHLDEFLGIGRVTDQGRIFPERLISKQEV